jgi:hypothetical protein
VGDWGYSSHTLIAIHVLHHFARRDGGQHHCSPSQSHWILTMAGVGVGRLQAARRVLLIKVC